MYKIDTCSLIASLVILNRFFQIHMYLSTILIPISLVLNLLFIYQYYNIPAFFINSRYKIKVDLNAFIQVLLLRVFLIFLNSILTINILII